MPRRGAPSPALTRADRDVSVPPRGPTATEGVVKPLFLQDNFFATFVAFLNVCEQQDDGSGLREVCQWARGLMASKGMH